MIELSKTYKIRGKDWKVELFAVRLGRVYGMIQHSDEDASAHSWCVETGRRLGDGESELDLIEVKPRIKRDVWINVYDHDYDEPRTSRNQADRSAGDNRIACVKVTLNYEEGQFDV